MKVVIATANPDKVAPLLEGGAVPKETFVSTVNPLAISDNPRLAFDIALRMLEDESFELADDDYAVMACEFDRSVKGETENIFYDITQCIPISIARAQAAESNQRSENAGGPGRGGRR